jgi:prevent-host-death family protein
MRSFGAFEAKNRLSELLELVEHGEEITITKHGRPVARLVAPDAPVSARGQKAVDELLVLSRELRGSGLSWRELRDSGRKY